MKRSLLVLFILTMISQSVFAITELSGLISSQTLSDSIHVTGDLEISSGGTVIIDPGTVFLIDSGVVVDINGAIQAEGTITDSIYFLPTEQGNRWKGFDISSLYYSKDSTIMNYCSVTGAENGFKISSSKEVRISHSTISDHLQRAFNIYNSNVKIDNCHISNNKGGTGAGIYMSNDFSKITNCHFSNNIAETTGGAIYMNSSSPFLESNTFSGNTPNNYNYSVVVTSGEERTLSGEVLNSGIYVMKGGVLRIEAGTKILSQSYALIEIRGSLFVDGNAQDSVIFTTENESARSYGFKFLSAQDSDSSRISFAIIENARKGEGAAVYAYYYDKLIIEHCDIRNNSAGDLGGGIYLEYADIELSSTMIRKNSAEYGGGLYMTRSTPVITDCIITENSASEGTSGGVSLAYAGEPVINMGTKIYGNSPENGVFSKWIRINKDTTFSGVVEHYGFTIDKDVNVTVQPGTIFKGHQNSTIYVYGQLTAIGTSSDSIIFGRVNDTIPWGGFEFNGAYSPDSTIMEHCVVTGAADNGGIYLDNHNSFRISNSRVSYNTGKYRTGGIYCNESAAIISNCTISYNTGYYGGINYYRSAIQISDCLIQNNTASIGGGGIYANGSDAVVKNTSILNNIGGGVYVAGSGSNFINCVVAGNSDDQYGGFAGKARNNTISFDSQIYDNYPSNSIHSQMMMMPDTTLSGVIEHQGFTVDSNVTVRIAAGTIFKGKSCAEITVRGTLIAEGTDTDTIIFTRYDDTTVWRGVTFKEADKASDSSFFNYIKMDNCNKAYGGAFYVSNFSKVRISNSYLGYNTASEGGGIYLTGADINMVNTTLFYNRSVNRDYAYGGGIYLLNSNPTLTNCVMENNRAIPKDESIYKVYGNAIYSFKSEPHFNGTKVTNTIYADSSSYFIKKSDIGEFYSKGSNMNVTNSNLGSTEMRYCNGYFENSVIKGYTERSDSITTFLTFLNCEFSGSSEGGINLNNSISQFIDCNITNNSKYDNGFYNNEAWTKGGGVLMTGSAPLFRNCRITKNRLSSSASSRRAFAYGGGFYIENSDPTMINCEISGNTVSASSENYDAYASGSGIYAFSNDSTHTITMTNCTVINSISNPSSTEKTMYELTNTIFFNNSFNGSIHTASHCYFYSQSEEAAALDNNIFIEPTFFNPDSGDYRLIANSSAINAGTPDTTGLGIGESDLNKVERIYSNQIDIGAFEYMSTTAVSSESEVKETIIYPNPVVEMININTDSKGRVYVVDLASTIKFEVKENSANISFLKKGIYILLIVEDGTIVRKDFFYKQ